MANEPTIGVDMASGPDRTAIIVRDEFGRYRLATEAEILRLRKQQAWCDMKGTLQDEG